MGECPICGADDPQGSCKHFVLMGDTTFPYAAGDGGAAFTVFSEVIDAGLLGELSKALDPVLARGSRVLGQLSRKKAVSAVSPSLPRLLKAVAKGAQAEESQGERNPHVDMTGLRDYLAALLKTCPGYVGKTEEDQNLPIPGASSLYVYHWAHNGKACGKALQKAIWDDLRSLQALEESG